MSQISSPPQRQIDLGTQLVAAWENLADASGKVAQTIQEIAKDDPDLAALKSEVTDSIVAIANAAKILSILATKIKP